MKKLLILFTCIILFVGCEDKPNPHRCAPSAPEVPGIYSKSIGMVKIDGEECQLFETYEKYGCRDHDIIKEYDGCSYKCYWKVLTRITKCPAQTTVNEVHQERTGKSSHEVIN